MDNKKPVQITNLTHKMVLKIINWKIELMRGSTIIWTGQSDSWSIQLRFQTKRSSKREFTAKKNVVRSEFH